MISLCPKYLFFRSSHLSSPHSEESDLQVITMTTEVPQQSQEGSFGWDLYCMWPLTPPAQEFVIHSQQLNSPSRRNYFPSSSHCFQLSTLSTCLLFSFRGSICFFVFCSFSPPVIWESTMSHHSLIHPNHRALVKRCYEMAWDWL